MAGSDMRATEAKKTFAGTNQMLVAAVLLVILASLAGGQNGQDMEEAYASIAASQGLVPIVPGLIRISSYTNFFLTLGDQIDMTAKQRREIEELVFSFHQRIIQLAADRRVAEAELDRLLAQQQIPLKDVRAKLKEIESIYVRMHYQQIETAIKVIERLNQAQHMKIILAIRRQRLSGSREPATHQGTRERLEPRRHRLTRRRKNHLPPWLGDDSKGHGTWTIAHRVHDSLFVLRTTSREPRATNHDSCVDWRRVLQESNHAEGVEG